MPASMRTAFESDTPPALRLVTRDPAKVHVHSIPDADLSPANRSWPVLIMRGGASAPVVNYSVLAEDLASHGYVVVGFDAPYRTKVVAFPDGRVIRRSPANDIETCIDQTSQSICANRLLSAWTSDLSFATGRLQSLSASDPSGRFTGRLDMSKLGVFGHSFGGAQAAQFCHDDSRCKAGIDIDGLLFGSVIAEGMHQPFMFLLSGQIESSAADALMFKAEMRSIYDRLPPYARRQVEIRGANHFFFSDDGAFLKSHIITRGLLTLGIVGIDGARQMNDTALLIRAFFDRHLKGSASSIIPAASALYPEIRALD